MSTSPLPMRISQKTCNLSIWRLIALPGADPAGTAVCACQCGTTKVLGPRWGSGGAAFDVISEHTADAIAHVVDRAWPTPGERFLDIATGTGWTARHLTARGAVVTGIDIGDGMIEAAKRLGPGITFQVGDAEALTFEDGTFDGVTSTFGVMFVARPAVAAGETARVTRKRGRLALVTRLPGGPVEDLCKLPQRFMSLPPAEPLPSPFEWSREERVRELLVGAFELTLQRGINVLRIPSGQMDARRSVIGVVERLFDGLRGRPLDRPSSQ